MRALFFVGLMMAIFGLACGEIPASSASSATSDSAAADTVPGTAVTNPLPTALAVSLEAILLNDPEADGYPTHEVRLVVNGTTHSLDTVVVCPALTAAERGEHDIPSDALAACGGWYAGGGDYFYALQRNDSLIVYQGWLDEMQQDEGYHYESVWAQSLK